MKTGLVKTYAIPQTTKADDYFEKGCKREIY